MSLLIHQPGPQATIQAGIRYGHRHQGVPASGPADALSHALANRVVGNPGDAPAVEIPLGGFRAEVTAPVTLALFGAPGPVTLDGEEIGRGHPIEATPGQQLEVLPFAQGLRTYLAVRGGLAGQLVLGSRSTYLPARFGGLEGRALQPGDRLAPGEIAPLHGARAIDLKTGVRFRERWLLRACPSGETALLPTEDRERLFGEPFTAGRRGDRMGLALEGQPLTIDGDGRMPSAAVFPGTVQCPGDGVPFLLGADAQTTGGYPRIAQVIRADRHLIGQIRPGDKLRFVETTPEQALKALTVKARRLEPLGLGFPG